LVGIAWLTVLFFLMAFFLDPRSTHDDGSKINDKRFVLSKDGLTLPNDVIFYDDELMKVVSAPSTTSKSTIPSLGGVMSNLFKAMEPSVNDSEDYEDDLVDPSTA
jgi:hypothetical protein